MAHLKLKPTDFLPNPKFSGENISYELALAHWLSFSDYLDAHQLCQPADVAAIIKVTQRFKLSLSGEARLWIEGKVFTGINEIKQKFIDRFSPTHSDLALVNKFQNIIFSKGDSIDKHLELITRSATKIGYGDTQIKHRFLQSLPDDCRTAVVMATETDATAQQMAEAAQKFLDCNQEGNKTVSFSDHTHAAAEAIPQKSFEFQDMKDEVNQMIDDKLDRSGSTDRTRSPRGRGRPRQRYSDRHRSFSGSKSPRPRPRYRDESFVCRFCQKKGHTWRKCFEYLRLVRQQEQERAPMQFQGTGPYQQGQYQQGQHQQEPYQQQSYQQQSYNAGYNDQNF